VTAEALAAWHGGVAAEPGRGTADIWSFSGLSGSFDIEYEYDGDNLYILHWVTKDLTSDLAQDTYDSFAVGLSIGLAVAGIGEGDRVDWDEHLSFGDESSVQLLQVDGEPGGHILRFRDGEYTFQLLVGGAYTTEPAELEDLVRPKIEAMYRIPLGDDTDTPPTPVAATNSFWSRQRAGANLFNRTPTPERFAAAGELGLDFVRLAPNKWPAARREFLVGDADGFEGIPAEDLERLRAALDQAHEAGLSVVLTTLTLPGSRWRQHNDGRADRRLWTDLIWHRQSAELWAELARALRDHPAVAAYNPLNEPFPEVHREEGETAQRYFQRVRGTAADLDRLYAALVGAIRGEDPSTAIILDAGEYASPAALSRLAPIDDDGVLYAFHLYEPWEHTTWRVNRGRTAYGGPQWNRQTLATAVQPVLAWQREHGIPAGRIVMGELGCDRRVPNAEGYLRDATGLANEHGWHWAFYSFREDSWDGMDYELGSEPLPSDLVTARDRGEEVVVPRRPNPIFGALREAVDAVRRAE
jgi:hypothetical protein